MNALHSPDAILDQRRAETLSRLFNMAYNSAILYGGSHQTTLDAAVPLFNFVKKFVEAAHGMLSIIVERESVFIENFCVDKIINVRRIVAHFKKAGLQSVSFDENIGLNDVRHLFSLLGDNESYPTVDEMKKGLLIGHCEGIRLNYVVYRKMTADEAIVNKDSADVGTLPSNTIPGAQPAAASSLLADAADIVSIKQLLDQPQLLQKISDTDIRKTAGPSFQAILSSIHSITSQIKNKEAPSGFLSSQEFAQAVYSIKKEVSRNIGSIKASVALEGSQAFVLDELETMSQEAVLRIVREEYQGGAVSIKRLSQIIRRIVPDVKDLKRLLPRLKETLLTQGMVIADYLKLVTEIRKDLDSDGMAGLFDGVLEEIGVSMQELISTIKEDPTDAARLIILASEIRKKGVDDGDQVSALLTDYVERVSKALSLDSKEVSGTDGIRFLKTTVASVQKDLVEKLKHQGIPDAVLERAGMLLSVRLNDAVNATKKEWLDRLMASYRQSSEDDLLLIVPPLLQNFDDTALVRTAVLHTLAEKGYSEQQTKEFFEKASPRQGNQQQMDLPKGVLNVNATVYFLEREIKRQQRYGAPFACVIATPLRLWSKRGAPLSIGENETRYILPQVMTSIRRMLRELDLVGSLGFVSRNIPFIILPMTDDVGAQSVVSRLEKAFSAVSFECNREPMTADFTVSYSSFDPASMPGYQQYIEYALTSHKKKENEIRKTWVGGRQPLAGC